MATKLSDFYAGDTKRWYVTWETDISGATGVFNMSKTECQETPDVTIPGTLLDPDPTSGDILGFMFEIDSTTSAAIDTDRYYCHHFITLSSGDTGTVLPQTITVKCR